MTHRELQDALDHMEIPVGASEAHGWLCGTLCVRGAYGAGDWQRELASDSRTVASRGPSAALCAVREETLDALRSPDFDFAPLLPGDEAPLPERIAALTDWCNGFLYGIGSHAVGGGAMHAGDVGEFLGDLSQIARAELEPGRAEEAAETDFAELYEFVRAGTQLAWVELAATRAHAGR
jgi:uncharacterized protein